MYDNEIYSLGSSLIIIAMLKSRRIGEVDSPVRIEMRNGYMNQKILIEGTT
jgi:hypothetical protein